MPDAQPLLLFLATALLLNITPGPDMLFVLASSLRGRESGLAAALGVGAGSIVHIALVSLGLAAVLESLPAAFELLRLGGALYLIYLGLRLLLTKPRAATESATTREPDRHEVRRAFWRGALTNILNPKVALFFLAFLPQFADPARGSLALQLAALGAMFAVSGTVVNCLVALAASAGSSALRRRLNSPWLERWLPGALFLSLGLRLALLRR